MKLFIDDVELDLNHDYCGFNGGTGSDKACDLQAFTDKLMRDMPESTEEACSKSLVSFNWKLLLYLMIGALVLSAGFTFTKCMRQDPSKR